MPYILYSKNKYSNKFNDDVISIKQHRHFLMNQKNHQLLRFQELFQNHTKEQRLTEYMIYEQYMNK